MHTCVSVNMYNSRRAGFGDAGWTIPQRNARRGVDVRQRFLLAERDRYK